MVKTFFVSIFWSFLVVWGLLLAYSTTKQMSIIDDYATKPRSELVDPHPCYVTKIRADYILPSKPLACWLSEEVE